MSVTVYMTSDYTSGHSVAPAPNDDMFNIMLMFQYLYNTTDTISKTGNVNVCERIGEVIHTKLVNIANTHMTDIR